MIKRITTFAVFVALMVVGGYILYGISKLVLIPGSKFIVMGPYLTFVMIMPLIRYPRFGTLSLINFAFGGIMIIFSPWMTLSIILSGIMADFAMLLPVMVKIKQLIAMGIYNGVSLLTSFYISNYITGNALYSILNFQALLTAFVLAVIAGLLGGYAGLKVDKVYLKALKK